MYNVLICDDEKDIVNALTIYLSNEGYKIFTAYDGAQLLEVLESNEIHLVLLDIMMPVMDGMTALKKLREKHNIPVIFLTAKSQDTDKVLGLDLGADDYIVKPFEMLELVERVKAVLRRTKGESEIFEFDGIRVEFATRRVYKNGSEILLKPKEFDLLAAFITNRNLALSRDAYAYCGPLDDFQPADD